jgi:hypothetical protein
MSTEEFPMRDKLPTILLALGFAVAGSAGTAVGYTLAHRGTATVAAPTTADTAPPAAPRAGGPRGPRAKAKALAGGASPRHGRSRPGARGRAQAHERGRSQSRTWATLAEGIDISPEQEQAWQQMMSDIRARCVAERLERGDSTFEVMMVAISGETLSDEELHARVEESLEARRTASHCVLEEVLEFRAQLEPEQRAALVERVGQLQSRREAWLEAWSE